MAMEKREREKYIYVYSWLFLDGDTASNLGIVDFIANKSTELKARAGPYEAIVNV